MSEVFRRFATAAARAAGTPWAFALAVLMIAAWAASGPVFGFNDTWQLWANTGTTIVTFLMVFLIQNAQNRDTKAVHLKLDELLLRLPEPHSEVAHAEQKTERELERLADAQGPNGTSDYTS